MLEKKEGGAGGQSPTPLVPWNRFLTKKSRIIENWNELKYLGSYDPLHGSYDVINKGT